MRQTASLRQEVSARDAECKSMAVVVSSLTSEVTLGRQERDQLGAMLDAARGEKFTQELRIRELEVELRLLREERAAEAEAVQSKLQAVEALVESVSAKVTGGVDLGDGSRAVIIDIITNSIAPLQVRVADVVRAVEAHHLLTPTQKKALDGLWPLLTGTGAPSTLTASGSASGRPTAPQL